MLEALNALEDGRVDAPVRSHEEADVRKAQVRERCPERSESSVRVGRQHERLVAIGANHMCDVRRVLFSWRAQSPRHWSVATAVSVSDVDAKPGPRRVRKTDTNGLRIDCLSQRRRRARERRVCSGSRPEATADLR